MQDHDVQFSLYFFTSIILVDMIERLQKIEQTSSVTLTRSIMTGSA